MSPANPEEIAIFGAGPAGLAAAIGLVRGGARVVVFERAERPAFKPGEILEPAIRGPLRELGVWERFLERGYPRASGTVASWGSDAEVEADAVVNPFGGGFFADRADLDGLLLQLACENGVRLVRAPRSLCLDVKGSRPSVRWKEVDTTHELAPGLIVDATGRGAAVSPSSDRETHDRLVAVLAYQTGSDLLQTDPRLALEATPTGWWYSAPLRHESAVFAFLTDGDLLPRGAGAVRARFRAELALSRRTQARFAGSSGGFRWHVRLANSSIRRTLHGPNWVAIGDAASTYDPLSGRGVLRALQKGAGLARILTRTGDVARATSEYAAAERDEFRDYLNLRDRTYARERRWSSHAFWRRRHAARG